MTNLVNFKQFIVFVDTDNKALIFLPRKFPKMSTPLKDLPKVAGDLKSQVR